MEEQNTSIPARSKRVEVATVTLVHTPRGAGTKEDPYRIITEVWSQDGKLIAVEDPEIRVAPFMTNGECADILRSFIRHRERMHQEEVTFVGPNDEEMAAGKIDPEADILYQATKFALSCVEEKIQK